MLKDSWNFRLNYLVFKILAGVSDNVFVNKSGWKFKIEANSIQKYFNIQSFLHYHGCECFQKLST